VSVPLGFFSVDIANYNIGSLLLLYLATILMRQNHSWFADIAHVQMHLPCCIYSGTSMEVQCFEIKTEADSNDSTLCSDDDKPSTGMFIVSDSRGLVVTSGVSLR